MQNISDHYAAGISKLKKQELWSEQKLQLCFLCLRGQWANVCKLEISIPGLTEFWWANINMHEQTEINAWLNENAQHNIHFIWTHVAKESFFFLSKIEWAHNVLQILICCWFFQISCKFFTLCTFKFYFFSYQISVFLNIWCIWNGPSFSDFPPDSCWKHLDQISLITVFWIRF